jgi:nicotinamidase-related amidase
MDLLELELVTPADVELYRAAGFGRTAGLGRRPALLVIDVQYRTTGHHRVPIAEAMREYPTACGSRAWDAVDRIAELLGAARETGVPVLFAHVAVKTATTTGGFRLKTPTLASPDPEAYGFVAEAAPRPGEPLIAKDHPSAFFATSLATHLISLGVDTLILCGATTSGCVRATAVDAFSLGFRVGVVADAVFDRLDLVHQASLFDIAAKYGDLLETNQITEYFREVMA